jgi:hypothetical protein
MARSKQNSEPGGIFQQDYDECVYLTKDPGGNLQNALQPK